MAPGRLRKGLVKTMTADEGGTVNAPSRANTTKRSRRPGSWPAASQDSVWGQF